MAAWEADLHAPAWDLPPCWNHGDIKRGNLLMREGRLAGAIDWSALNVGDPAGDLSIAWTLFTREVRDAFRDAMDVDDATWQRGRAWALIEGALALSYYRGKNKAIARGADESSTYAGRPTLGPSTTRWKAPSSAKLHEV